MSSFITTIPISIAALATLGSFSIAVVNYGIDDFLQNNSSSPQDKKAFSRHKYEAFQYWINNMSSFAVITIGLVAPTAAVILLPGYLCGKRIL